MRGISWSDASPNEFGPWIDDGTYRRAGYFWSYECEVEGEYLALSLYRPDSANDYHLSQDLVFALGLAKEGDVWVSPRDDYEEVVRQLRDESGRVREILIRSDYIRNYLCARDAGLLVATYRERRWTTGSSSARHRDAQLGAGGNNITCWILSKLDEPE